jgi:hypothetical protein
MLLIAAAGHAAPPTSIDPKAEEVITRSRTADVTYTIYWRIEYSDGSGTVDHAWGATFRKGSSVRVEDVDSRAVADCAAVTGTQFNLGVSRADYQLGKKVAQRYCGIDSDRKVRSARWLGQKPGKFGPVDEVEIVDEDGTFTYQVGSKGELLGVVSAWRGFKSLTVAEPMSIEYAVPGGDLFSRKSLASSKVPKIMQGKGARAEH